MKEDIFSKTFPESSAISDSVAWSSDGMLAVCSMSTVQVLVPTFQAANCFEYKCFQFEPSSDLKKKGYVKVHSVDPVENLESYVNDWLRRPAIPLSRLVSPTYVTCMVWTRPGALSFFEHSLLAVLLNDGSLMFLTVDEHLLEHDASRCSFLSHHSFGLNILSSLATPEYIDAIAFHDSLLLHSTSTSTVPSRSLQFLAAHADSISVYSIMRCSDGTVKISRGISHTLASHNETSRRCKINHLHLISSSKVLVCFTDGLVAVYSVTRDDSTGVLLSLVVEQEARIFTGIVSIVKHVDNYIVLASSNELKVVDATSLAVYSHHNQEVWPIAVAEAAYDQSGKPVGVWFCALHGRFRFLSLPGSIDLDVAPSAMVSNLPESVKLGALTLF